MLHIRPSVLAIYTLVYLCTLDATTHFVTTLLDDGSPGSLRETMANATSGDTIQFSVAGTTTLEEERGSLIVDKQLIIDGQNKITIDGANLINICLILTGSSDNSVITNLTIQNCNGHQVHSGMGTELVELPAYGILIDSSSTNCSIVNTTIKNIHSGTNHISAGINALPNPSPAKNISNNTILSISSEGNPAGGRFNNVFGIAISGNIGQNCSYNTICDLSSKSGNSSSGNVIGIFAGSISGHCSHNTISNLESGHATERSGNVFGIVITNSLGAHCVNNAISHLSSGDAINLSGGIIGIEIINAIQGNCSNNTIKHVTTGSANRVVISTVGITCNILRGNCLNNLITDITTTSTTPSPSTAGIQFSFVETNSIFACNTVARVSGGESITLGIEIEEANAITIKNNTINTVSSNTGPAYGMRLGNTGGNAFFRNSLVVSNAIKNIIGNNFSGFGIALFGDESVGNDLFTNSIFAINGKAIDIFNHGIPTDARVSLISARCADGCKLIIAGHMIPSIDTPLFKIQFFVSDSNIPEQTQTFIGEHVHDTTCGTAFEVSFSELPLIEAGAFITATATALPPGSEQNNNTSEVSNALVTCMPFSNVCSCPPSKPIPPAPCPVTCSVL